MSHSPNNNSKYALLLPLHDKGTQYTCLPGKATNDYSQIVQMTFILSKKRTDDKYFKNISDCGEKFTLFLAF